jgi:hypothetical protein
VTQPEHVQTSHPNRKLGRLPADPTQPRLRLARYQVARPSAPPTADWTSQVRTWGMLANDRAGDCTIAGAAHVAIAVDRYGQGRDLTVTDDQVLAAYSALTGYDGTDATDTGATLQDALGFWHSTGIADQRIAAFAELDPQDLDQVRACIAFYGAVYCGMNVSAAAEQQFDEGQPWTDTGRSRNLGGHCVPLLAYDADTFTAVTWGRPQRMTVDFYRRFFDECWVPIDLDWLAATGRSPAGLDTGALNADYEALTGKPGPFPDAPAPVPAPSDPDAQLVAAFAEWRAAKHHLGAVLAAAVQRWKTEKGLR